MVSKVEKTEKKKRTPKKKATRRKRTVASKTADAPTITDGVSSAPQESAPTPPQAPRDTAAPGLSDTTIESRATVTKQKTTAGGKKKTRAKTAGNRPRRNARGRTSKATKKLDGQADTEAKEQPHGKHVDTHSGLDSGPSPASSGQAFGVMGNVSETPPAPSDGVAAEGVSEDHKPSQAKSPTGKRPRAGRGKRRAAAKKSSPPAVARPTDAEEASAADSRDTQTEPVSIQPISGSLVAAEVEPATTRPTGRRRGRRGKGRRRQAASGQQATPDPQAAQPKESTVTREEALQDAPETTSPGPSGNDRVMLINVSVGDECRIAIVHKGRLEELFLERTSAQSHVGNIYKGRVVNVDPGIQAAFVDFGLPKNGFLHVSDVQPQYFPDHSGSAEAVGKKIPRHQRPPVQKCFRRGQEVIVQVIKEGVGTKGPTLSTYLSIPGRFLVMMPGMSRQGVSRKIEDDADRRKMREQLKELTLPPDMGFILRTAGLDRTKRELQRDLTYLQRLWKTVVDRVKKRSAPAELYRESDLVTRTIRDVYTVGFGRIVVDDRETAEKAREFLRVAMPRSKTPIELYADRQPLFHRFGIEAEIEEINLRHVPLKSGGSLVIDSTEALVAIDVNSGRFHSAEDAEEMAFAIDMEAAEEIARQLRLRDLGGLIVCDFIDLRQDRHKRAVEKTLRDALKQHKERIRILRMSAFGLVEMTRQRQRPSIKKNIYFDCPHCRGSGVVKMPESVILDVMRTIQLATHHSNVRKMTVTVASEVAFRILNEKRSVISRIEGETGKTVIVHGDSSFTSDQTVFVCEDDRGHPIHIPPSLSSGRKPS